MNQPVDPNAFRRLLRERGKSGEDLRRALGMSASTLAKLYGGEPVSDFVFRRVVGWLQDQPVLPVARTLMPAPRADAAGGVASQRSA